MKLINIIAVLVVLLGFTIYASAYIVDEREQVVVTRFGKVVGEPKQEPNIYFKIPLLDIANYFPKNLQQWDGDAGQIPTLDKTYIWVNTFARWKIVDPVQFMQSVKNTETAKSRLDDIIDPATRNLITSYKLIESVRKSNRELVFEIEGQDSSTGGPLYNIETGREKITNSIMEQAQPKLLNQFGIELIDVKIKRINYVEEVRESVYGRMIAERKQIAEKFRSEGQGEARKWLGRKEKDLKQISSEAYKQAQEIKGKADAEATKIYAQSYGIDPTFYSFIKTMEIYGETLTGKSSVVLSTESEFLKYLKDYAAK